MLGPVLLLMAAFLVESMLGGPFGKYAGVPVRLLLAMALTPLLLFLLLRRGRVTGAHGAAALSITGFLIVNGIWITVVPVLTGTRYHWALREPHAFLVLVPVVLLLAVLGRGQLQALVPRLQRLVVIVALVLALFQLAIWGVGTAYPPLQYAIPLVLDSAFPGADDQLKVGPTPEGFFRVFWISTLWCVLAFFWVPAALRSRLARGLARGLLLLAVLVSWSRGIWLGLVLGQAVVWAVPLTRRSRWTALAVPALAGLIAVGALVGALAATGELERGLARATSTTSRSDQSIGARLDQAGHLLRLWQEHPVIGNGYGAYVPGFVRSQEAPYSYEHMPYAILSKLGLLGVLAAGLIVLGWGWSAWRARHRAPGPAAAFLGASAALVVADMTNPLLLHFVSITIFGCLLVAWADLVSPDEAERPDRVIFGASDPQPSGSLAERPGEMVPT